MYKCFCLLLLLSSFKSYSILCPASFGDVAVHQRIDTENNLQLQGFSEKYTDQFDQAVRLVELKKYWQKIKADPQRNHLPHFAKQISSHVLEIKKGIEKSPLPEEDKKARLQTLGFLEWEGGMARRTYKVTYIWWSVFNIRLIALASSSVESAFNLGLSLTQVKSHEEVYKLMKEKKDLLNAFNGPYVQMLEEFPNIVLFPSVGRIGPMAFNQTMNEGIHFIGVSGVSAQVDGKILSPQDYFKHDVEHTADIEKYLKTQNPSFHSQLRLKIRSLPKERREQQEFAYFLLLRERELITKDDSKIFQKNLTRFLKRTHDINLLPASLRDRSYKDQEEYEQVLREYFNDMESYYNKIVQEVRNSH